MSNLIPVRLRDSFEQLRNSLMGTLDAWTPHHVPVNQEEAYPWPSSAFSLGGPAIEVTEDAKSVHVAAELPGLNEKDFNVEIAGDRLILRGEKRARFENNKEGCYFSECRYGSFSRMIDLPCEVNGEKAEAHYQNGVLRITLPKKAEAQGKRIPVRVA